MAYILGDIIAAADLNGFINTLNTIWDVGNTTRGYGQDVNGGGANIPTVVAGAVINGSDWSPLVGRLTTLGLHQTNTAHPGIPAIGEFNVGELIESHSSGGAGQDLPLAVSTVDTNRLLADAGSMTLFTTAPQANTDTRTSDWGGTATPASLVHEVTVTFASENDARYFFNSGGEIRFDASLVGGSTSQSTDWANLLSAVGVVSFDYTQTTVTGSGTGSAIGYYDLTSTSQQIYTNTGAGAYTANDYTIFATRSSFTGVNGGNGAAIVFEIEFNDDHTNPLYPAGDVVDGTLTSTVETFRATTYLTILPPTLTNSGTALNSQ